MVFIRLVDKLNRVFFLLIGIAFGIMTLSIFLQVLVRFVFSEFNIRISVPWTEEIARYLMIWSVFVGGAIAARKDRLIALESLVHALPRRLGIALKVGALLITIFFFSYLITTGYDLALHQGLSQTSPVLRIPMMCVYFAMPVGAVIATLNIIALLIETYLTKKDIRFISLEEEKDEIDAQVGQGGNQ